MNGGVNYRVRKLKERNKCFICITIIMKYIIISTKSEQFFEIFYNANFIYR